MSEVWHGGKGSKSRPMNISQKEWDNRWDAIFRHDTEDKNLKDEFQDILSTEDCVIDALENVNSKCVK